MNKETLISKWLNNDLNDQELEAFKMLEDYDDLVECTLFHELLDGETSFDESLNDFCINLNFRYGLPLF